MKNNKENLDIYLTIVYGLVFSDLFLAYFPIGPFPVKNYILFFGVLLVACERCSRCDCYKIPFGPMERVVFGLLIIGLAATLISGGDFPESLLQAIRILIIPYFIYMVTTRAVSRDLLRINKIIIMYYILVAISSFVAILQFLEVEWAWQIRSMMPISVGDQDGIIANALEQRHRPMGMAYFPISLGYQTVWAFPLAWYAWAAKNDFCKSTRLIAVLSLILIIMGGLASGTRSTLLAIVVQVFILMAIKSGANIFSIANTIKVFLLTAMVLLGAYLIQGDRWLLEDSSALGKIWLSYVGILYAVDNPIGQGFDWSIYNAFKMSILSASSLIPDEVVGEIEQFAPHNQFINSVVIYGWLGLLLIVHFYWSYMRRLYRLGRENLSNSQSLSIPLFCGFVGYLINSLFHNAGLFVGDHLAWYFVALSVMLIKFSRKPDSSQSGCTFEISERKALQDVG